MSIIIMFIPILFIGAIFIGQCVWVAMDSRKKNEEYWWLWTIAAFIAFPVGLTVYVLVTRSGRSICNNCGKEVPHNVNSCPYCGMKCGLFCPSCGQKVEKQWKYCPNCTAELPDEIKNAKSIKKSNKVAVIVIISVAVLFFLPIVVFLGSVTYTTTKITANEEFINGNNYIDSTEEIGVEYDTEYTGVRTYTKSINVNSVAYYGQIKNGKIIIRILDSENNVIAESKSIKDKKINDVFISDNGSGNKVQIEYKDFKGKFYFSF